MKLQLLTISAFLCGISLSSGQNQTVSTSILTNEITELCSLSPEQIVKVEPIIAAFEQKRDYSYKKYHSTPTLLKKEVKQNRWDYEVSLIGLLTPEQMGLLKAFDQRNSELMCGSGTEVTKVDYLKSKDNSANQTEVATSTTTSNQPEVQEAVSSTIPLAINIPSLAPILVLNETSDPVAPEINMNMQPTSIQTAPATAENNDLNTQNVYQSVLIDQMKELCELSPEQLSKVQTLVAKFETKRNEALKKYHSNSIVFAKAVRQNKWDYEVSLIGTLTPEQMGLIKAFDQRNPDLMAGTGSNVNSVAYLVATTK